jgi:hypothetical protein
MITYEVESVLEGNSIRHSVYVYVSSGKDGLSESITKNWVYSGKWGDTISLCRILRALNVNPPQSNY